MDRNTRWLATFALAAIASLTTAQTCSYSHPPSPVVAGIALDLDTHQTRAPGSDVWVVTWGDDGHIYTTFGDGGGFGGTDSEGRVKLGLARIEGGPSDFVGVNVWGGANAQAPSQFGGKGYGLLALGSDLYLWRTGTSSGAGAYRQQELWVSRDRGLSFEYTGVHFVNDEDFPASMGFFAPTFLQFGPGYSGARDGFVYGYAPEVKDDSEWEVQFPGEIALMRAPADRLDEQAAWEFFAGLEEGEPRWTPRVEERQPVFRDAQNGVMRTSVSYNPGLGRYFLITQQGSRFRSDGALIGIYEAPEPWGPWSTVLLADPWDDLGLQHGHKTVRWGFANKWLSADGRDFVLVYTDDDEFASVEGRFVLPEDLPELAPGEAHLALREWLSSGD